MSFETSTFIKLVVAKSRDEEAYLDVIRKNLGVKPGYRRSHDRHLAQLCVFREVAAPPHGSGPADFIKLLCKLMDREPPRNKVFDPDYYRSCWKEACRAIRDEIVEAVAPSSSGGTPAAGPPAGPGTRISYA